MWTASGRFFKLSLFAARRLGARPFLDLLIDRPYYPACAISSRAIAKQRISRLRRPSIVLPVQEPSKNSADTLRRYQAGRRTRRLRVFNVLAQRQRDDEIPAPLR